MLFFSMYFVVHVIKEMTSHTHMHTSVKFEAFDASKTCTWQHSQVQTQVYVYTEIKRLWPCHIVGHIWLVLQVTSVQRGVSYAKTFHFSRFPPAASQVNKPFGGITMVSFSLIYTIYVYIHLCMQISWMEGWEGCGDEWEGEIKKRGAVEVKDWVKIRLWQTLV